MLKYLPSTLCVMDKTHMVLEHLLNSATPQCAEDVGKDQLTEMLKKHFSQYERWCEFENDIFLSGTWLPSDRSPFLFKEVCVDNHNYLWPYLYVEGKNLHSLFSYTDPTMECAPLERDGWYMGFTRASPSEGRELYFQKIYLPLNVFNIFLK